MVAAAGELLEGAALRLMAASARGALAETKSSAILVLLEPAQAAMVAAAGELLEGAALRLKAAPRRRPVGLRIPAARLERVVSRVGAAAMVCWNRASVATTQTPTPTMVVVRVVAWNRGGSAIKASLLTALQFAAMVSSWVLKPSTVAAMMLAAPMATVVAPRVRWSPAIRAMARPRVARTSMSALRALRTAEPTRAARIPLVRTNVSVNRAIQVMA